MLYCLSRLTLDVIILHFFLIIQLVNIILDVVYQFPPYPLVQPLTISSRPFLSCLLPLCQNESSSKTIHIEICAAYMFIVLQIELIFIRKVLHTDSPWNRGTIAYYFLLPKRGNSLGWGQINGSNVPELRTFHVYKLVRTRALHVSMCFYVPLVTTLIV